MRLEDELLLEDTQRMIPTLAMLKHCKSIQALKCLKEAIDIRIKELRD